jgi:hypothetical protein
MIGIIRYGAAHLIVLLSPLTGTLGHYLIITWALLGHYLQNEVMPK